MPTPEQDLAFVQAGLEELETHLLSDPLFWRLSRGHTLPRLTPGSLLLALMRLQLRAGTPPQAVEVHRLKEHLEVLRIKWHTAWENKALQESHTRLRLWREYLTDYLDSPDTQADLYPQQVSQRVLLEVLSGEVALPAEEQENLAHLDRVVKSAWLAGDFIWEPELQPCFPQPGYWFLYGRLRS